MRRLFAGLFVVALVAGACGDDDDGGEVTQAQFVERANAICAESNEEFEELFETGFPTSPERLLEFFEEATLIVERTVEGIRELDVPEEMQDDVDELLELGDAVLADFREASEDQEAASELFAAEGGENDAALREKSEELGLTVCAEEEGEGEGEGVTLLDPSTFSPEKRAFVEEADAICAVGAERDSRLEEQYLDEFPPPLENWAEFLPAIAAGGREDLEKLRALTPPPGDEEEVNEILDEFESLVDEFARLGDLAVAGDSEAFDEGLNELFPRFDELEQMTAAYGFQVCGIEPDGDEEDGEGGEEE